MSDKFIRRACDLRVRGVEIYEGYLQNPSQMALLDDVRAITRAAPLFRPVVPNGGRMSVRMTSAGTVGWYADHRGYRYIDRHPAGSPWPAIPESILKIWDALSGASRRPDSCLVNFYDGDARMGLHQDKDEADVSCPVVSISLGDDALFRIGGTTRTGGSDSVWLRSGDVVVMGGDARLCYHGIDRIAPDTSTLLPRGGRINLTLRVAR
jgi:alkylated DNA repair protein (DNA oxidative demethylase)